MVGFAANSLLCRAALGTRLIDPQAFTSIRIAGGAIALHALVCFRVNGWARVGGSWDGALALVLYAFFFSWAYVRLDAGIGALILFGVVQLTMVGWGIAKGSRLATLEWAGLGLALTGLALLTVPGKSAPPLSAAWLMAAAGLAWGAYSLIGRQARAPLEATAGNFMRGALLAIPLGCYLFGAGRLALGGRGAALAAVSGAVTSGLAYAIWYAVLPRLRATQAAITQLSVPILAALGGALWLQESFSFRKLVSSVLVLGGILLATGRRR